MFETMSSNQPSGNSFSAGPSGDTPSSPSAFQPYVPRSEQIPEFTWRAVLLGLLFAILFGVASVYLALRAGMTVAASIPISVLAIGLRTRRSKRTILENNLIQTIGSIGGSIAGNMIYTTVAFLFLAEGTSYFGYIQLVTLAFIGALLGILLMVPLRRSLIVKEHGTLLYPEGKACAEVLIAGEQRGNLAKPVFWGAAVASLYWVGMKLLGLWNRVPHLIHQSPSGFYPNATFPMEVAPEYLGIGYIIGPKASVQIFVGGLFTWLVLIPLFSAYPSIATWLGAPDVATILRELFKTPLKDIHNPPSAGNIHAAYVKLIALGAVVGAGVLTLLKTFPVIVGSFRTVLETLRSKRETNHLRTEKELPMRLVVIGAVVLVLAIAFLPQLPGAFPRSLVLSLVVLVCAFFFVTVSSRFVGVVGYSVEPVSSMMFTTAMGTCLLFFALGWTKEAHQLMVVAVGALVCLSAGISGATSQDLKTGFLLGATPYKQQIGLIISVLVSSLVVAGVVILVDGSLPKVPHAIGYLAPDQETPDLNAPQATLLAMLIKVGLGGKMIWGLVLLGVGLAVVFQLTGATALSIAAGMYLPLSTTSVIFLGALIRWVAERRRKAEATKAAGGPNDKELSKGTLYATGLVAGGALMGMFLGLFPKLAAWIHVPKLPVWLNLGHEYWKTLGPWSHVLSLSVFAMLGITLYGYARKK